MKTNKSFLAALSGFILIGSAGIFGMRNEGNNTDAPTSPMTLNNEPSLEQQKINTKYKNGVYKENGQYLSPGGTENIDVEITLENDQILSANVTPHAELPASKQFQEKFMSGYKELVIGKNIDEVRLDKVSGSSLTPIGFNEALEKVKTASKI